MRTPSRLVLLGHPVAHSHSPVFQNAALESAGIRLRYETLDVTAGELSVILEMLARENAAGNVTIPYKEAVAQACKRLAPVGARAGAVNTFWVENGSLAGDNTDVAGFDFLVSETLGAIPANARVAVLGAGGAAAAVLTAAEGWNDSRVTLCNRSPTRAGRLAERFSVVSRVTSDSRDAVADATIVVNATSIGLDTEEHPVPLDAIDPGTCILDLVYRRDQTAWVRAAHDRGMCASDGLPMLIEQGALAFERWLGVPAPRDVMRAALRSRFVT